MLEESSGTVTKTYTLGHDIIAQADNVGSVYYLLKDGHGSTRALLNSSGQIVAGQVYAYDAFGNAIGFIPADALTTHLYCGEICDATGLIYLCQRYYRPGSGTFMTTDPATGGPQDPQTLHKYLYCHADPINFTDPTGQMEFTFAGLMTSIRIGATVGGLSGATIGATRGAIKGGLQGAMAGAWNGFLWGAAAGASIGAGGYSLGCYFVGLGMPMVQAYGSATFIAATPWRIASAITLGNAIKSRAPVDIGFASLGFILGYLPVTEGVQWNSFIGGYLRSLPFVKSYEIIPRSAANAGTGGGGWLASFAEWRLVARITLSRSQRWVRVIATGKNRNVGEWVALESELIGRTPAEIKQYLGTEHVPDAYVPVDMPTDTIFDVGQAGPQPSWGVNENGGLQFRIISPLQRSWFGDPRPIGARFEGIK